MSNSLFASTDVTTGAVRSPPLRFVFLLPLLVTFVMVAICFNTENWSLKAPVGNFVLYTSLSLCMFFVFCVAVRPVPLEVKFRFCALGGLVSFSVALFLNELLIGLATAADQRLSVDLLPQPFKSEIGICNVWLELCTFLVSAFAEELWKLLALRLLLRGDAVLPPQELAICGACVGFGFTLLENMLYFRSAVVGDDAWKAGVGRALSGVHVMLTALAGALLSRFPDSQWLAVLVCGLFHAGNNITVAALEKRFAYVVLGRVLGVGNLLSLVAGNLRQSLLPRRTIEKTKWLALLPSTAMFSGFACLFALQHSLKRKLDIPDDDSPESFRFSYCVSALYWGQLLFRFGHVWLFSSLSDGARTCLALTVMAGVLAVLALAPGSLATVGVCYWTGGAALGTFEGNFVQLLGRLHPEAKLQGISGIPVGIFLVVVVGFGLLGLAWVSAASLYCVSAGACIASVWAMSALMKQPRHFRFVSEEEEVWSPIVESAARSGLPSPSARAGRRGSARTASVSGVVVASVVYFMNMTVVSSWSPGVLLYLYNQDYVSVKYIGCMQTSLFFSVFSSFGFAADLVSRKCVYLWTLADLPVWVFLLSTGAGVTLLSLQQPLLAPAGTLLVFLANGSIYACSCRLIDRLSTEQLVARANSWFFAAGDLGSILGASLIPHIRSLLTNASG